MKTPALFLFCFTQCLLFSLLPLCFGEISYSEITTDARPIILFDTFGFNTRGHININITGVQVFIPENGKPVDRSLMGFFISTAEAEIGLQNDINEGKCVLLDPGVHKLFTLLEADQQKNEENMFSIDFPVPDAQEYSLFFANCQPDSVVSMDVKFALYNLEWRGVKDYLPAGRTELPALYYTFFLAYLLALIAWVYLCYDKWSTVHRLHILMGFLILFKALTVLSQAGEFVYIKNTGAPQGWNIAFYIFSFFRGVMLFTVIVLIGTGWSFLKPYLQDKDKNIIMIVIPLQVFANIAVIILDESGPSSREWFTWRDIFHLLDIICCCAILFPIVWSIRHLREASLTDGKAARNFIKLSLFRQFYIMVVCYIYFTRIVVYLLKSSTPYHYAWTADFAGEVATLVFYIFTGYSFRPVEQNPYLVVDDEEEQAAALALKEDDDFEL